jgi:hypothetical protein
MSATRPFSGVIRTVGRHRSRGDECKGTYPTRAEARRAQQRLEGEAAGSEPPRNFIIMDNLERVVM